MPIRDDNAFGIHVGNVIKHTSADCKWTAEMNRIDENDLYVTLRSETGGVWFETWNLAHTQSGLNDGTYIQVLL